MRLTIQACVVGLFCVCVLARAGGAQDPFGVRAPGSGAAGDEAAAEAPPPPPAETDPRVLAVEAWKPATVEQLVTAAEILVNLNREDAARPYLAQVLGGKPDAAVLVALHRRFGSPLFVRFALNEELKPEGAELAEAVMSAASLHATSNAHVQAVLNALADASADVRRAAMSDLLAIGRPGIAAVVSALADTERAPSHEAWRASLVRLGPISREPLLAALDSGDPALVAQVMDVLGSLGDRRVAAYLLGPAHVSAEAAPVRASAEGALGRLLGRVPTADDSAAYLRHRVDELLARRGDGARMTTTWQWDATRRVPVEREISEDMQRLVEASRLARDLAELAEGDARADARRLALALELDVQKRLDGHDRPITLDPGSVYAAAAGAGVEVMEAVLVEAVKRDLVAGEVAAAEILGQVGTPELLVGSGGRPRPLAEMLRHPSGHVRFAAAQAILELGPTGAFPGCSQVAAILADTAAAGFSARALVVEPRTEHAQSLAAYLESAGYVCDLARTGRELVWAATESDYSFALVADHVSHPGVGEVLQWLRRDYRTARLPVGILATQATLERFRRIAEADGLAIAVVRPTSDADLDADAARLQALHGAGIASAERERRALVALHWLGTLAQSPAEFEFYDVARHERAIARAMNTVGLAAAAAPILGQLASPAAQRALVELASQPTRPIEDRRAAAAAFEAAVRKHRVLLTTSEILHQYDRYNRTESLDAETQQVMGSILDAIENSAAPTTDGRRKG